MESIKINQFYITFYITLYYFVFLMILKVVLLFIFVFKYAVKLESLGSLKVLRLLVCHTNPLTQGKF